MVEERGYKIVWCELSPKDLGIPQERGRCFIYGQKDDDGKAALRQSRFVPFINSLKRKNGSRLRKRALSEFLLPEDDPEVKAEKAKLKRCDDVALLKDGSTEAGGLWVHDHATQFEQGGIDWVPAVRHVGNKGRCPYDLEQEDRSIFYHNLTDRDKHFLLYWSKKKAISNPEDLAMEETLEIGNNLKWSAVRSDYTVALTPGAKIWARKRGRCLLGIEKFQLQGAMRGTFDRCGLSSNRLSDLAGNMVNNLCWMAVIAGAYYCMGSEVSDADVREAQGVPGPTDKEDEPMNKEDDDGDSDRSHETNEEDGGDSLENKEEKSDVSSSASS